MKIPKILEEEIMEERLQKFLAQAGVASRRKAEELIAEGKIKVNGRVVKEQGVKINPRKDKVEYKGKLVTKEDNKVYILLNKPIGYITTSKDQFDRKTVLDLLKDVDERVYPVGRLDANTSGLLLLTNDGDFAYKITHPKHELKKKYIATVKGVPTSNKIAKLEKGIQIEDYVTAPAKVRILEHGKDSAKVEVIIHEGRNKQVRKMLEAMGHPVTKLKRVAVGDLTLRQVKIGSYRHLTGAERKSLLEAKPARQSSHPGGKSKGRNFKGKGKRR